MQRDIGRRERVPLVLAALAGSVHGLFSVYWGLGGDWLLATLGTRIVAAFADLRWVVVPVGLAKIALALAPVWLADRGWPWRRVTRASLWAAGAGLTVWGGLNTVTANLVLFGLIHPDRIDRPGLIGHAWLWDPLFCLWGAALLLGLWRTRRV